MDVSEEPWRAGWSLVVVSFIASGQTFVFAHSSRVGIRCTVQVAIRQTLLVVVLEDEGARQGRSSSGGDVLVGFTRQRWAL